MLAVTIVMMYCTALKWPQPSVITASKCVLTVYKIRVFNDAILQPETTGLTAAIYEEHG
jgi:hypothetical protein